MPASPAAGSRACRRRWTPSAASSPRRMATRSSCGRSSARRRPSASSSNPISAASARRRPATRRARTRRCPRGLPRGRADLPSFPKKLPIVLFATVIAFLFAIGSIVAKALLSGDPPAAAGPPAPAPPETEPVPEAPVAAPCPRPRPAGGAPPPRRPRHRTVEPEVAAMIAPLPADPRPSADPVPAAVAGPGFAGALEPAPLRADRGRRTGSPRPSRPPAPLPFVEARYDLDVLVARLDAIETAGGGRRVLLVGTGDEADPRRARPQPRPRRRPARPRPPGAPRPPADGGPPGLADLVAGRRISPP